eukprot:CAMPEP_0197425918 /NCGR_PEP_ID=MMETSP1170-20131217/32952_1 /TAXON_ID=54406 /ORGANISM="Sarcinochrysis sp, Strain CCMP770" /LENGTH=249 /DNA_ID=CAMNT_0042953511 /DNA_START=368 /DNA_END=1119 /DNA_ORIENTATION=+
MLFVVEAGNSNTRSPMSREGGLPMQGAACGRRPDHGSLPEAKKITNVSHVRVDLGEWLPALVVAHGDPMLRGTMVSSPQVLLRPTIMRRRTSAVFKAGGRTPSPPEIARLRCAAAKRRFKRDAVTIDMDVEVQLDTPTHSSSSARTRHLRQLPEMRVSQLKLSVTLKAVKFVLRVAAVHLEGACLSVPRRPESHRRESVALNVGIQGGRLLFAAGIVAASALSGRRSARRTTVESCWNSPAFAVILTPH